MSLLLHSFRGFQLAFFLNAKGKVQACAVATGEGNVWSQPVSRLEFLDSSMYN